MYVLTVYNYHKKLIHKKYLLKVLLSIDMVPLLLISHLLYYLFTLKLQAQAYLGVHYTETESQDYNKAASMFSEAAKQEVKLRHKAFRTSVDF